MDSRLLRTLARGVLLYCAYYSFFTLGIHYQGLQSRFPISASGICWSACVIIFAVELAREWPKDVLHSYALGSGPRLAPSPKTGCRGVGLPVVLAVGRGCLAEAGSLPIVKCGSGGLRCDRLEEDHVRSSHEQRGQHSPGRHSPEEGHLPDENTILPGQGIRTAYRPRKDGCPVKEPSFRVKAFCPVRVRPRPMKLRRADSCPVRGPSSPAMASSPETAFYPARARPRPSPKAKTASSHSRQSPHDVASLGTVGRTRAVRIIAVP